ncbi:MAG: c-type cytochrome [Magnetococcales bacterium]|nr:c-type cytochrome [Magnetococcales bacterium]MBF0150773.1 c-type cytochrome [Magnetococcales bacterium]
MNRSGLLHIASLLTITLTAASGHAMPADLYFSMAVTENSHNHAGSNLLFLKFQEKADPSVIAPSVVISPRVNGNSIKMDGRLDDWDQRWFTTLESRVMNNYPLSEFYDATAVPIQIASAYDQEHIYFAVRFEDANHDDSLQRRQWIFDGTQWHSAPHTAVRPEAPAGHVINKDATLAGREDEDQVFFMFPMVDQEGNFRDGGMGCGGYCHPNLVASGDPKTHLIGDETAGMHTSLPGDVADLWHWTSTRSNLGNTLKDGHIVHGEGIFNGRMADDGQSPDLDNDLKAQNKDLPSQPAFISVKDFQAGNYAIPGFKTEILRQDQAMPIPAGMNFAPGVQLPYSIVRPATGSRSDVMVMANYDPGTFMWTLEFKRALNTGDAKDRAFIPGPSPLPPTLPAVLPGNPERGAKLFADLCKSCHGEQGEGKFENGAWIAPPNQRASGSLIAKTTSINRIERLRTIAHEMAPPKRLMSFVPISQQDAEDIASWLQRQSTR